MADLYSGQMLGAVTDMSYSILSVVPKYEDGTVIEDLEDAIVMENGKELKAWEAIAGYMESFPDTDGDGTANVPAYYEEEQGRKVVEDSTNLLDLIKNPNKYAVIITTVAAAVILLVAVLIVFVVKLVKCRTGKRRG